MVDIHKFENATAVNTGYGGDKKALWTKNDRFFAICQF